MASPKRIGFFWGEEKITVVEFERNVPVQVVSAPIGSKTNVASPFSSNLTEEIQITAILQKMLQENHIVGGAFYVSLPMKEIILRSFIIPFVKRDEIQGAIRFEAKKYMPFDIQDLAYVFHTIPFMEGQSKRLQVIFFATRKEVLTRYERIFKQVNADITYCEPYMVSLTKALLFRKEIKPVDYLAFLVLDKNFGRISFIDQGIPQFIREFAISSPSQADASAGPGEGLNAKIVNEVGNSFDFYARQFSGERIEQMLVSSDIVQKDLLNDLESELKVKLKKFVPVISTAAHGQSNDMDAIYAMGACVAPPMDTLSGFNFLGGGKSKSIFQPNVNTFVGSLKEIVLLLVICLAVLAGTYFFFQSQLKTTRQEYVQLSAKQGMFLNLPLDIIQTETQSKIDELNAYKDIRVKSNITFIILRVASHLPEGALLNNLNITYNASDSVKAHVSIDMSGDVFKEDPDEQIAAVNKVFSDLKQDKALSKYVDRVNLVSLNRELFNSKQVTGFNIHCS